MIAAARRCCITENNTLVALVACRTFERNDRRMLGAWRGVAKALVAMEEKGACFAEEASRWTSGLRDSYTW